MSLSLQHGRAASSTTRWFRRYRASRKPVLRLFCFPYAGGTAAVFDGWQDALPASVDVFAVQAPGRAERFAEPPIADLERTVALLQKAIDPFIDVPYIFVGHSNGALTAFALARALQVAGDRQLRHLVISAKKAPHMPHKIILHRLPHEALIAELSAFSATPTEFLADRELMDLLMPTLRADLALSETGNVGRHPRVRARCTLFYGCRDNQVTRDEVLAWRQYVEGPVSLKEFDGDHFFIDRNRHEFIDAIRDMLNDELSRAQRLS